MNKVLMIFPPFCIPTSPPHSLAYFTAFFKKHFPNIEFEALDLNLEANIKAFGENPFADISMDDYEKVADRFFEQSFLFYKENNKKILNKEQPFFYDEILNMILDRNPDIILFSCFYNQQLFYSRKLSEDLMKKGMKTILGGPAADEETQSSFTEIASDEASLSKILGEDSIQDINIIPDFSSLSTEKYFYFRHLTYPVRFSRGCIYGKCAFCTHPQQKQVVKKQSDVLENEIKNKPFFYFIDDTISPKDMMDICKITKKHKNIFYATLRPASYSKEQLEEMYSSGLKAIIWGVESGDENMLKKMDKGTCPKEISRILRESKEAGIINIIFIMFGFPGEDEKTTSKTLRFLDENQKSIDLISTSIFSLKKGSPAYHHPEKFGIEKITPKKRTFLPKKFEYRLTKGFTSEEAKSFRKKNMKQIRNFNKIYKNFNYFRDHLITFESRKDELKNEADENQ